MNILYPAGKKHTYTASDPDAERNWLSPSRVFINHNAYIEVNWHINPLDKTRVDFSEVGWVYILGLKKIK